MILYFSGAGATKNIAETMFRYVSRSQDCTADLFSIASDANFNKINENFPNVNLIMNDYDAFIIGTPVYHAAPSRAVRAYFNNLSPLIKTTPAFIYNTRAFYSCNTNRILSKQIRGKNILTIIDREYRSPASDGVLIVPFIRRLFNFEKNLYDKIEQLITFKIYLHKDKYMKCGKCIKNCPHHALEKGDYKYSLCLIEKCENCYRCIHHCPAKALSLNKYKSPKELLAFDNL